MNKEIISRGIHCFTSPKPPYQVGDYLYARETWGRAECRNCPTEQCSCYPSLEANFNHGYIFRADSISLKHAVKWHPSIHMPKEAARIFLRVTDVRVERLQCITIDGIEHEGISIVFPLRKLIESEHLKKFVTVWNSTIKKKDLARYGWAANPWVWVIEFERVAVSA